MEVKLKPSLLPKNYYAGQRAVTGSDGASPYPEPRPGKNSASQAKLPFPDAANLL
jgi:hypothetical protein